MAKYRLVMTDTWEDPDFQELTPELKLLFIYLFTNQSTSESGIYPITLKTIANATGVNYDKVCGIFKDGLLKNVFYDSAKRLVFVANCKKYNVLGGRPDLLKKSIRFDYERTKDSKLWEKFIEKYPECEALLNEPLAKGSARVEQPHNITTVTSYPNVDKEITDNPLFVRKAQNAQERAVCAVWVLDYLNVQLKGRFPHDPACLDPIESVLEGDYSTKDCFMVIDDRIRAWKTEPELMGKTPEMADNLRPGVLFNVKKFSDYWGIAHSWEVKRTRAAAKEEREKEARKAEAKKRRDAEKEREELTPEEIQKMKEDVKNLGKKKEGEK